MSRARSVLGEVVVSLHDGDWGELGRSLSAWIPARGDGRAGYKLVKDAVWGMVELPGELLPFIDAPLMQRQRRIRQLGLSYLTYPTATHTRFEHALGCLHLANQILARTGQTSDGGFTLQDTDRRSIRLAALLHDVGHMPFSHASERALEESGAPLLVGGVPLPEVGKVLSPVLGGSLKLAEVLSVLVLLCPGTIAVTTSQVGSVTTAVETHIRAAAYIAGVPLSADDVGLAEMISGPLDVDRLDYMARDGHACGIPIAMDVPRLLSRCKLMRVQATQLPPAQRAAAERQFGTESACVRFITDPAGANAFEELAMSRLLLYGRIYQHHKTVAAESLLADLLASVIGDDPFEVLDFWGRSDDEYLGTCSSSPNPRTRALACALLNRRLPTRALVFGHSLLRKPALPLQSPTSTLDQAADTSVEDSLKHLDNQIRDPGRRRSLQAEIAAEMKHISSLLGLPAGACDVAVSPRPLNPLLGVRRALIRFADGTFEEIHLPLEPWAGAFLVNKSVGYVHCESGLEDLCLLASEVVLARQRPPAGNADPAGGFTVHASFRLGDGAPRWSKRDPTRIGDLRRRLDDLGPPAVTPAPRPLAVDRSDVRCIAARFASYQGPGGWHLTEAHVEAFLRQFPCRLQAGMVAALSGLVPLRTQDLVPAFRDRIASLASGESGVVDVVPLSATSGARWVTELKDVLPKSSRAKLRLGSDLDEALTDSTAPLILIDDLIASGTQAACVLHAWLGTERVHWPHPSEANVPREKLAPTQVEALKARNLHLLVGAAAQEGLDLIRSTAATLGLNRLVVAQVHGLPEPLAEPLEADLQDFLRDVGTELLRQHGHRDPAGAALGAGVTGLVVGLSSAPACLPAALCVPGRINDVAWRPLFLRRGYADAVVLS